MSRDPRTTPAPPSSNPFGLAEVMPRVLATIFVIEGIIMVVLARWPLREPYETIADATTLSLVSAPILYLWIVRPLRQRIRRHLEAESIHERAMEHRMAQMTALHRLGREAVMAHDVDAICGSALDALQAALAPDRCAVVMKDGRGHWMFRASRNLSAEYVAGVQRWELANGFSYAERTPDLADLAASGMPGDLAGVLRSEGVASYARAPIEHEGLLIGRLMMYWNRPHVLDAEETLVAQSIASHVAVVLDRARREADQRRLALAMEAATDSIVLTEPDGRILRVNPAFTTLTGHPAAEALGRTPAILASGVQDAAFYREMWATIRSGRSWTGRLVNRRLDGTLYHAWLAISPVLDAAGGVTGYVGVERDISADIRREDELRRNAADLEAANSELVVARDRAEAAARAKAEFLATMSHELRTPMNGVLGFAHLLSESGLDAEQQEFVETIRTSGQSLLALLNDILDFSKIEAGRMTLEQIPYDLRATLRDVLDLLRTQARSRGVTLVLEGEDAAPAFLAGDPVRVRQVLTNLVGNAIKFTHDGHVTLRVRTEDGGARLRIEVQDSGIGIPADKIGTLFQQFSQVDASTTRRFGGTGLGLAICKRLVELMDGTIGVESREGEGATFAFTLPVVEASASEPGADATPATGPVRRADGRAPRVLVAEDNGVNQKLVRRLLERSGCEVDIAANGRQAVEMVERGRYHLVIMDCHMPEMDGFAATRAIRSRHPRGEGLPIIALTANAFRADQDACIEAGMDDFLTKPIVPGDLHRCLERWAA